MAPRRGVAFGGIEFDPGAARRPAAGRRRDGRPGGLPDPRAACPTDARGAAFLEVPHAGDVLDRTPPRRGRGGLAAARRTQPLGEPLHEAVVRPPGLAPGGAAVEVADDEVDPDLWETPTYSSSGEEAARRTSPASSTPTLYAWIAGESKVVTGLRRHLVNELGIDRRQVAFMGYWRRGVAMRSWTAVTAPGDRPCGAGRRRSRVRSAGPRGAAGRGGGGGE